MLTFGKLALFSFNDLFKNRQEIWQTFFPPPPEPPPPVPEWERLRKARFDADDILEHGLSLASGIHHPGARAEFIEQCQDEYTQRLHNISEDM